MTAVGLLFILTIYTTIPVFHGELTSINFKKCPQFFVDASPPTGFKFVSKIHKGICQDYNGAVRPPVFSTLYDTVLRIPLYSAYVLQNGNANARADWVVDDDLTKSNYNQAAESDYNGNTKTMDRGHLAPRQYFAGDKSDATFSLTNIVPQNRGFNTGIWNLIENAARNYMLENCAPNSAFFITGAIPGTKSMGANRVNIPASMYTAACCIRRQGRGVPFSFGYFAKNTKNPTPRYLDVTALGTLVKQTLGMPNTIKFFKKKECNRADDNIITELENRVGRR